MADSKKSEWDQEAERLKALQSLPLRDTQDVVALDALLEAAAAALGCKTALLVLNDEADPQLRDWVDSLYPGNADLPDPWRAILCTSELLFVSDTHDDDRFSAADAKQPWRFVAACPIALDGYRVLGALCVLGECPRSVSPEDTSQLQRLTTALEGLVRAGLAASAVENAVRATETARSRSARERQMLEQIADVSGIGGWEMDLRTQQITWTDKIREILEVGAEFQPDLESVLAFYDTETRNTLTSMIATAIETHKGWDREVPFITAKGKGRWAPGVGRPVVEEGVVTRIVGAFRDITEERLTLQRIKRSDAVQRAMFAALNEGIILVDPNGIIRSCNPAAATLLGGAVDTLEGCGVGALKLTYFSDADQPQEAENVLASAAAHPERVQDRMVWLSPDSSKALYWVKVTAAAIDPEDSEGMGGVVISLTDMTLSRQQADNLQVIFDNFPGGVAFFDRDGALREYNDQYRDMLNLTQAILDSRIPLRDLVRINARRGDYGVGDPEKLAEQYLAQLMKPGGAAVERSGRNGATLEVRQTPVHGGGFLTTVTDITPRKRAERRLREKERIATEKSDELAVIVANMRQGVSVFNKDGELTLWNEQYLEVFSKPVGEVYAGVTLRELIEAEKRRGDFEGDVDEHVDGLMLRLVGGEVVQNLFRHANGKIVSSQHAPLPGGGWIGTHEDVTLRERAAEKIAYAAYHDTLTGLANRTLFQHELEDVRLRAEQEGVCFALLLLDLDRFKPVNDTYGHAVGDRLLQQVAQRMRDSVRSTDVVARLGGDEFGILISYPNAGRDLVSEIADRLVEQIGAPYKIDGETIAIGTSIGGAWIHCDNSDIDLALKNADSALYKVKRTGRNGFEIHRDDLADPGRYKVG